jgi:hypothetical protein
METPVVETIVSICPKCFEDNVTPGYHQCKNVDIDWSTCDCGKIIPGDLDEDYHDCDGLAIKYECFECDVSFVSFEDFFNDDHNCLRIKHVKSFTIMLEKKFEDITKEPTGKFTELTRERDGLSDAVIRLACPRIFDRGPPETFKSYSELRAKYGKGVCSYMESLYEKFGEVDRCESCLENCRAPVRHDEFHTMSVRSGMTGTSFGRVGYCFNNCAKCIDYRKLKETKEKKTTKMEAYRMLRISETGVAIKDKSEESSEGSYLKTKSNERYFFSTVTVPPEAGDVSRIIYQIEQNIVTFLKPKSTMTCIGYYGVFELTENGTPHLHILFKVSLPIGEDGKIKHYLSGSSAVFKRLGRFKPLFSAKYNENIRGVVTKPVPNTILDVEGVLNYFTKGIIKEIGSKESVMFKVTVTA